MAKQNKPIHTFILKLNVYFQRILYPSLRLRPGNGVSFALRRRTKYIVDPINYGFSECFQGTLIALFYFPLETIARFVHFSFFSLIPCFLKHDIMISANGEQSIFTLISGYQNHDIIYEYRKRLLNSI